MSETDADFMTRLQTKQVEQREQTQQFEDPIRLDVTPGELNKLIVTRAYGKQNDQYGDWMALSFDPESPVTKGYKGKANTWYTRGGVMRTVVQRVLRELIKNGSFPVMTAGYSNGDAIEVDIPEVTEPVNIQFVVVEGTPKEGQERGFLQVFGEVVPSFDTKWEKPDAFVQRMETEMADYLKAMRDEKFSEEIDEGEKIGHKQLEVGTPYHVHLTRAILPKEDPTFMILRIDKDKSELGGSLEKGKYNRLHLSNITLKTFLRIPNLPAMEGGGLVQVGYDEDKKKAEYVTVPKVPEGGVSIRFFRQEREGANYSYKECLGEVVE